MCDIGQICDKICDKEECCNGDMTKVLNRPAPMPVYLWFTANVEPESELNMQTNRIRISIPATWFYWEIHIGSQWSVSTACCVVSSLLGERKRRLLKTSPFLPLLTKLTFYYSFWSLYFQSPVSNTSGGGGHPGQIYSRGWMDGILNAVYCCSLPCTYCACWHDNDYTF